MEKGYEKEFIMIQNQFIKDVEKYNHREQFIYSMISGLSNDLTKSTTISVDLIIDMLGVSLQSKNRGMAKDVLISMEEKGLISLYEDLLKQRPIKAVDIKVPNVYYAVAHEVEVDEDQSFTKIRLNDLLKFINLNEKGRELYFSIYYNIVRRIFDGVSNRDYSFPNIDTLEKETGINRKTIMKYIKTLKENEILYYETVKLGKFKDKNLYSRWDDRQFVTDAVERIENGVEEIEKNG